MAAPTITPNNFPLDGKGSIVLKADQAVTWSASGGQIQVLSSSSARWTAPNVTGSYTITATNASNETGTAVATVTGVFPSVPHYPYTYKRQIPVNASEAKSGRRVTARRGPPRRVYELEFRGRSLTEYAEVEEFWAAHHPDRRFRYVDLLLDLNVICLFDSDIQFQAASHNAVDFKVNLVEAL